MDNKVPDKCKSCKLLWTKGFKDNKHNKWCCRYGKPAYKAIGHCNLERNKIIKKGGLLCVSETKIG